MRAMRASTASTADTSPVAMQRASSAADMAQRSSWPRLAATADRALVAGMACMALSMAHLLGFPHPEEFHQPRYASAKSAVSFSERNAETFLSRTEKTCSHSVSPLRPLLRIAQA